MVPHLWHPPQKINTTRLVPLPRCKQSQTYIYIYIHISASRWRVFFSSASARRRGKPPQPPARGARLASPVGASGRRMDRKRSALSSAGAKLLEPKSARRPSRAKAAKAVFIFFGGEAGCYSSWLNETCFRCLLIVV